MRITAGLAILLIASGCLGSGDTTSSQSTSTSESQNPVGNLTFKGLTPDNFTTNMTRDVSAWYLFSVHASPGGEVAGYAGGELFSDSSRPQGFTVLPFVNSTMAEKLDSWGVMSFLLEGATAEPNGLEFRTRKMFSDDVSSAGDARLEIPDWSHAFGGEISPRLYEEVGPLGLAVFGASSEPIDFYAAITFHELYDADARASFNASRDAGELRVLPFQGTYHGFDWAAGAGARLGDGLPCQPHDGFHAAGWWGNVTIQSNPFDGNSGCGVVQEILLESTEPGWSFVYLSGSFNSGVYDGKLDIHGYRTNFTMIEENGQAFSPAFGPGEYGPWMVLSKSGPSGVRIDVTETNPTHEPQTLGLSLHVTTAAPLSKWFGKEIMDCWAIYANDIFVLPTPVGGYCTRPTKLWDPTS